VYWSEIWEFVFKNIRIVFRCISKLIGKSPVFEIGEILVKNSVKYCAFTRAFGVF